MAEEPFTVGIYKCFRKGEKMKEVFRKEVKYVISTEKFLRMKNYLEGLMAYDSYSGERGYRVRSLYFDSLNDQDFYDTIDGLMEKRKIRLRIYSHLDKKVKLEYKCKSGSDSLKYSLVISRQDAENMIAGDYQFLSKFDFPLARTIYMRLRSGSYMAKPIVEYHRLAYVYPVGNVRITYDTNVQASATPYAFFDECPGLFPVMSLDRGVLEVKYDVFLPGQIKEVIRTIDSSVVANSKYAQARVLL